MSRQYTLQRANSSFTGAIDYAAELNEQQLAAVTHREQSRRTVERRPVIVAIARLGRGEAIANILFGAVICVLLIANANVAITPRSGP